MTLPKHRNTWCACIFRCTAYRMAGVLGCMYQFPLSCCVGFMLDSRKSRRSYLKHVRSTWRLVRFWIGAYRQRLLLTPQFQISAHQCRSPRCGCSTKQNLQRLPQAFTSVCSCAPWWSYFSHLIPDWEIGWRPYLIQQKRGSFQHSPCASTWVETTTLATEHRKTLVATSFPEHT